MSAPRPMSVRKGGARYANYDYPELGPKVRVFSMAKAQELIVKTWPDAAMVLDQTVVQSTLNAERARSFWMGKDRVAQLWPLMGNSGDWYYRMKKP